MRFGTSFVGSAAVAGNFEADCLMRLDDDGISMDQALRDFGLDPAKIPAIARKAEDVLAYVEIAHEIQVHSLLPGGGIGGQECAEKQSAKGPGS